MSCFLKTNLEDGSDDAAENGPENDGETRLKDDLLAGSVWVDVPLVYVVSIERRDGKLLGVGGAGDSHEELESDEERTGLAKEVRSHGRWHQPIAGFCDGDGQVEGAACKSKRCGHAKRDGEPGHAAEEVALPDAEDPNRSSRIELTRFFSMHSTS